MQERRQPEVIAGRVSSVGASVAGDGFTVVKGSTGVYTLRFPGMRLISATFTSDSAGAFGVHLGTGYTGGDSVSPAFFATTTGTATDVAFSFVAVGVQT